MQGINEINAANNNTVESEALRKATRFTPLSDGSVILSSRGVSLVIEKKEAIRFLHRAKAMGEKTRAVCEFIESFFSKSSTWANAQG